MAYNPTVGARASGGVLVEVKGVTHRFERDGTTSWCCAT